MKGEVRHDHEPREIHSTGEHEESDLVDEVEQHADPVDLVDVQRILWRDQPLQQRLALPLLVLFDLGVDLCIKRRGCALRLVVNLGRARLGGALRYRP